MSAPAPAPVPAPMSAPAPLPAAAPAPAAPVAPKKKGNPYWAMASPFVLGGTSGMFATCCIQPIDMIKVRIQLLGEGSKVAVKANPFTLASQVIAQDGFLSLYTGLGAGLLRQATYTTARLGIFRTVSDYMAGPKKETLPFYKKFFAGMFAGGLGSMLGTPADVALIRMQADTTLPPEQRRNYKGVVDALVRIGKTEGLPGFFAGNTPVVYRAMALNAGMLATNDQADEMLKHYNLNPALASFIAKAISGFFASAMSLPFDFIKTRMQKQKRDANGNLPYKSFSHAVRRVVAEEGVRPFYRGFMTYYVRIAPHVMITLWAQDHLKRLTKEW